MCIKTVILLQSQLFVFIVFWRVFLWMGGWGGVGWGGLRCMYKEDNVD